jgi:hypothetical protein
MDGGLVMSDPKPGPRGLAVGWVNPSARIENLEDAIRRLHRKVADIEALADDLGKKSDAAYEKRFTEDWAYHEGRGDTYEEAESLLRAALADPDSTQTSGHTSPAAGDTPEAAARKGSQPAVSGTHLGT